MEDYKAYAKEKYDRTYFTEFDKLLEGRASTASHQMAERRAQHIAILETFCDAYEKYDNQINATDIWNAIYSAHIKRKAGAADLNELKKSYQVRSHGKSHPGMCLKTLLQDILKKD